MAALKGNIGKIAYTVIFKGVQLHTLKMPTVEIDNQRMILHGQAAREVLAW